MFHYTSLQAGLWWLFHVTSLFAAVRFPAAYKQWEKKHYLRYLHIVLVLFGLTAPVLAVAIMSGTDGYTLPRFPPFTCSAADPDASYYSLVLVTSVYLAIGVSLMLALFMTLVKLIRKKTEKGNARLIDKLKVCNTAYMQGLTVGRVYYSFKHNSKSYPRGSRRFENVKPLSLYLSDLDPLSCFTFTLPFSRARKRESSSIDILCHGNHSLVKLPSISTHIMRTDSTLNWEMVATPGAPVASFHTCCSFRMEYYQFDTWISTA